MSVNLSKKFLTLGEVASLLGYPTGQKSNHRKTFRLLKAFEKRTNKKILINLGTPKRPRWFVNQKKINDFLNNESNDDMCLAEDLEALRQEVRELKLRIENLEMKE